MSRPAKLVLEDGSVFTGISFGKHGEVYGEVCFNTSMTGYQEILTDPSYRGQIVAMTYPHIGNYGVNEEDVESNQPYLAGFISRENSRVVSNFRAIGSLNEYLVRHEVVGLTGIDTRALVRRIRIRGAMKGVLSGVDLDDDSLIEKAKSSQGLVGRDLAKEVMTTRMKIWDRTLSVCDDLESNATIPTDSVKSLHVVALDFGMKWNIARHLRRLGCRVTVLPGSADAAEVLNLSPDGVFVSNGPGDPEPLDYAIRSIKSIFTKTPLFGICLGHQLLAMACGAKIYKLKFGHHGANQPVLEYKTGKVEITAQNHGFAVRESSLPEFLEITHRNLNDNTIAGLHHRDFPAFSVQYHPEASAGPHDSRHLFARFCDVMLRTRSSRL